VLQFAVVSSGALMQCGRLERFGFSPKISTPVENIVEKQMKRPWCRRKRLIYRDSGRGEGR
jgi:hypothetical protein